MNVNDTVGISRKTLVNFFVVDTSGSMSGSKITSVNVALEDTIPELAELSDGNPDSKIKIAMMEFSSGARWITNEEGPEELTDFHFRHFSAAGLTDLGDALDELNRKLSRKAFMKSEGEDQRGYFAPIIFFFTDGSPTDNWEAALDRIQQNNWYKYAVEIAVAIGDDANMDVLEKVTGNKECVVKVTNPKDLRKFIKFASVTSSMIGSKSSNIGEGRSKQDEVAEALKTWDTDEDEPFVPADSIGDSTNPAGTNPDPDPIDDDDVW